MFYNQGLRQFFWCPGISSPGQTLSLYLHSSVSVPPTPTSVSSLANQCLFYRQQTEKIVLLARPAPWWTSSGSVRRSGTRWLVISATRISGIAPVTAVAWGVPAPSRRSGASPSGTAGTTAPIIHAHTSIVQFTEGTAAAA